MSGTDSVNSRRDLACSQIPPPSDAALILPDTDTLALGALRTMDLEVIPLYAMLSALYQVLGGQESPSPVIASAQMARGLGYLGCEAELIVTCTSVYENNGEPRLMEDIGEWSHPPVIRSDGTTDAHVVVWTNSFNRCVDLGICQSATLRRARLTGEGQAQPAVLPVQDRDALLNAARAVMAFRGKVALQWMFFPEWTPHIDLLLKQHVDIIEHGGLALAHIVIDQLSAVAVNRDLSRLRDRHPAIGRLLVGEGQLPELKDPPKAHRPERPPAPRFASGVPSTSAGSSRYHAY
jgi:hypothetical protein